MYKTNLKVTFDFCEENVGYIVSQPPGVAL